MGPVRLGFKNHCAGKGQQQFSSQSFPTTVGKVSNCKQLQYSASFCKYAACNTRVKLCDLQHVYEGGPKKTKFVYKKFCIYFYITKL
jgi:hypothetical protein